MLVNANFQKADQRNLAQKIGKIFEDGYAAGKRKDGFVQKVTFAPSSIGPTYNGSCSRRWVLAFQGQEWEEVTETLNIAIMNAGTDAHTRLQNILEAQGVAVEIERELKLESPPIRGYADAVITVDGQDYVGEIKTTSNFNFQKLAFAGKPSIAHMIQVMIYMHITGLPGFVIYQNRDTLELLVMPVEWDQSLMDQTFDWLNAVYEAYQNNQLPVRDLYLKKGKNKGEPSDQCLKCPVRKACAELPDGDITIGKFSINK